MQRLLFFFPFRFIFYKTCPIPYAYILSYFFSYFSIFFFFLINKNCNFFLHILLVNSWNNYTTIAIMIYKYIYLILITNLPYIKLFNAKRAHCFCFYYCLLDFRGTRSGIVKVHFVLLYITFCLSAKIDR